MTAYLDTLTPADFKAYFTRDFKYVPAEYSALVTYFLGDIVAYTVSGVTNYYSVIVASTLNVVPTNTTNWVAYNLTSGYIADTDISKAFEQAKTFTNTRIFENNATLGMAFYYCAAHYMVMDLRMAEAGIDSRWEGLTQSKSVGSVSVSYSVPESFARDPQWAYFAQTGYGLKYLSMVIPRVTGRILTATSDTNA